MSDIFNRAFSYLEAGKRFEDNLDYHNAVLTYRQALDLFAQIRATAVDTKIAQLIRESTQRYETKVSDLESKLRASEPVAIPVIQSQQCPPGASASPLCFESTLKRAIEVFESGNQREKERRYDDAIDLYAHGCDLLQHLTVPSAAQTHTTMMPLIQDKLQKFSSKIARLTDLRQQILHVDTQARESYAVATHCDQDRLESSVVADKYEHALSLFLRLQEIAPSGELDSFVERVRERIAELRRPRRISHSIRRPVSMTAPALPTPATFTRPVSSPAIPRSAPVTRSVSAPIRAGGVLGDSSLINGYRFPVWRDNEHLLETFIYPVPFSDPDGVLALSQKQVDAGVRYARPSEFMHDPVMLESVNPWNIIQTLVGDCSFVCSVCVAAAMECRTRQRIVSNIIYPQNKKGLPIYNPSGKYIVKLFYNGVPRKVVIDDRLPVDSHGRLLCTYSKNVNELWISLLEKAYMKLNGGYDFPGSNSGIDLHALTGWVPEQIFFDDNITSSIQGHTQTSSRAWDRMVSAHQSVDCLITISTGTLTLAEEDSLGLVGGHAYAVMNIVETSGLKILQVKNPWATKTWQGRFSSFDRSSWSRSIMEALRVTDDDLNNMVTRGIFWILYEDVRKYFKSFFVNWNPVLFRFTSTTHDVWPMSQGPSEDRAFLYENPQYTLSLQPPPNELKPTVWVLLSRHVLSKHSILSDETFLTVHVHKSSTRLYTPAVPFVKGVYSSDPHVLARIDVDDDTKKYVLLLSQYEKKTDVRYSLSVYSTVPFTLHPTEAVPRHEITIKGKWARESAGGSLSCATFFRNPQYRLHVESALGPLEFHFLLHFPEEVSACISIVAVDAMDANLVRRIDYVSKEDEILSSGNYRSRFCHCRGKLAPGYYIIIPSTYTTQPWASFVLNIRSDKAESKSKLNISQPCNFSVSELPAEGAGMRKFSFDHAWSSERGTAAGCNNYRNYHLNPSYLIEVQQRCYVQARLQTVDIPNYPSLNLSLFKVSATEAEELANGLPLSTSAKNAFASSHNGVYFSRPCGAFLDNTLLEPGQAYVIVPATFEPVAGQYVLDVYLSDSGATVKRAR